MMRRWTSLLFLAAAALVAVSALSLAQQPSGWQIETAPGAQRAPAEPPVRPVEPPAAEIPPNTTIVPRSPAEPKAPSGDNALGEVSLVALLTEDGQSIEQGLVWRVFRDKAGPDGRPQLVSTHREASPTLQLEPGSYIVNVALGRAHLTRKIDVAKEGSAQERFVLNAGGLRLTALLANGKRASEMAVAYDIYSDETDRHGQRTRLVSGAKPGVIVRLNAGIYSLVSTYGDANAVARADVTVEAGKLTEVTLKHAAARVTFKLVPRAGGEAVADTQWSLSTPNGDLVKESVGAVPTHVLAPGSYTATAKHGGQVFQRQFTVQAGDTAQVEVVMR